MKKIIAALKGGKEFKNKDGAMPDAFVNIPYHSLDTSFIPRFIELPISPDDKLFDDLLKKGFTTYVIFDAVDETDEDLRSPEFADIAYNRMKSYFRCYILETTYTYQILGLGNIDGFK